MADYRFPHRHLLGIEGLNRLDIETLLELGDRYVELNRSRVKHANVLAGQTLVNLFFENSTRTQGSFEIAGRRLGVLRHAAGRRSLRTGGVRPRR